MKYLKIIFFAAIFSSSTELFCPRRMPKAKFEDRAPELRIPIARTAEDLKKERRFRRALQEIPANVPMVEARGMDEEELADAISEWKALVNNPEALNRLINDTIREFSVSPRELIPDILEMYRDYIVFAWNQIACLLEDSKKVLGLIEHKANVDSAVKQGIFSSREKIKRICIGIKKVLNSDTLDSLAQEKNPGKIADYTEAAKRCFLALNQETSNLFKLMYHLKEKFKLPILFTSNPENLHFNVKPLEHLTIILATILSAGL